MNREKLLAAKKRYRETHREQILAYHREWRDRNREHCREWKRGQYQRLPNKVGPCTAAELESKKRWYARNKEEISARTKRYRLEHPERVAETHRRYRANHKESEMERHKRNKAIRRAREYGASIGKVSWKNIIERDGMTCHLCHREVGKRDLSFDHVIPLSRGGSHTEDNLRIAHRICNIKKGASLSGLVVA